MELKHVVLKHVPVWAPAPLSRLCIALLSTSARFLPTRVMHQLAHKHPVLGDCTCVYVLEAVTVVVQQ